MTKDDIKDVAKWGAGALLYLVTLATLTTTIVTDNEKPILPGGFFPLAFGGAVSAALLCSFHDTEPEKKNGPKLIIPHKTDWNKCMAVVHREHDARYM